MLEPTHVCPRCKVAYPRTPEHFFFTRKGYLTGYCKTGGCHAAYWRDYALTRSARQLARVRERARDWYRARHAVPPERWTGERGPRVA